MIFSTWSRNHGKRAGGYCTILPLYHAPFIFSNFNGTDADVNVLTHEAGHAVCRFHSGKIPEDPGALPLHK